MMEEKILIVDDNDDELKKDSDILKEVGYEVFCCKSGSEALEYLNKNPVELVLLDVNMPEMNGYDVCLNIRKQFPLDNLPIIFLTNCEDSASVSQGFQSGASDFVQKSSAPDILLARIGVHLRLTRSLRNLRDISLTDDLTGAYNRRHAIFSLRELFARSKRYGTQFSMIYFDLNGLKKVNDQYGHMAGDLLLRSVVSVCEKLLRESDMLFRMGGDEFMVLCPDTLLRRQSAVVIPCNVSPVALGPDKQSFREFGMLIRRAVFPDLPNDPVKHVLMVSEKRNYVRPIHHVLQEFDPVRTPVDQIAQQVQRVVLRKGDLFQHPQEQIVSTMDI